MVMDSAYGSELSQTIDVTPYGTPHSAEVTRRPNESVLAGGFVIKGLFMMLPLVIILMGSRLLPAITCLRCKEYSIDCHGAEIKLDGHCLNCHEKGKKCEFESRTSDPDLDAPSSSPNPQFPTIDDEMLHPTVRTSNDNRTNIKIPDPQPDTPSSSSRQSYQNPPIKDPSRDPETANRTHGFTDDRSISGEPRIKPWWNRLFPRIFFSRKDTGAKHKRRS